MGCLALDIHDGGALCPRRRGHRRPVARVDPAEPGPSGGGHLAVLVVPAAAPQGHAGVHDVGIVVGGLGLDNVVLDFDVQGVVQGEAGVRLSQLWRLSAMGFLRARKVCS